jgi:hypothetical protein
VPILEALLETKPEPAVEAEARRVLREIENHEKK